MIDEEFQQLAKQAAGSTSRRQLLVQTVRLSAVALLGGSLGHSQIAAAGPVDREAALPTAANITCSSSNTFRGTCEEFVAYARECGPVLEPSGDRCIRTGNPIYGCTHPEVAASFNPIPKTYKHQPVGGGICSSQDYIYDADATIESGALIFAPDGSECCSGVCGEEKDAFNADTVTHEQQHVEDIEAGVAAINAKYSRVTVQGCGRKKKDADAALAENAAKRASAITDELSELINPDEPPSADINCQKCQPGGDCKSCDNGECRDCNVCETCENGDCVDRPNAQQCGDVCCGECQICDNGACRECNGVCERCVDGVCQPIPDKKVCGGVCVPTDWVGCSRADLGDYCCPPGPNPCSTFTPSGCN